MRQVILFLEPLWEAKNIEFDLELPEVQHTGDEDLLRLVWQNLIQNAIKFSADGGTIRIEQYDTDTHVNVRITDHGAGIAEADIPHIFDRFYKGSTNQGGDSTEYKKGKNGGNGLGLAIVHKIVEMEGGSVAVRSNTDVGTTFTVELPKRNN
jgi:signal transduction histidine kinase